MRELLDKILEFLGTLSAIREAKKKRPKKIPYVAICVGHSRIGDKGARSVGGVSEWAYNKVVADLLKEQLKQRAIHSIVIDEYPEESYSKAMNWLSGKLKEEKCDIAIELHFNSFTTSLAEGYEYLHYDSSAYGKKLALCLHKAHAESINVQKDRGVKAIGEGGRGYGFLKRVPPPAVICEPFFGSSPKEWVLLGDKHAAMADIYAEGIAKYFGV